MNLLIPAINNIGGFKFRQVLQPETGCFRFPVPELPGLDNLIVFRKFCIFVRNWILYANRPGHLWKRVQTIPKEVVSLVNFCQPLLVYRAIFIEEPADS